MKLLLTTLFTLFLTINTPNYKIVNEITIDEKHKIESTFSGNTKGENSFHLIIAKNSESKAYDIIPYLYDNSQIIKLETISFDKLPSILSFHNNNDVLSLITQSKVGKSEVMNIVDVNLVSGKYVKSEDIETEDFKTLIRKKDKNLIMFSDKDSIRIIEAKGANSLNRITVNPDESSIEFVKALSKNNVEAINSDEFVANGSISTFRAYSDGNKVILTEENSKEATTNTFQIPLNEGSDISVGLKTFGGKPDDSKIKKSTSYINNDKLFQFKLGKEEANLDIFSLNDASKVSLDILGVKPSKTAKGFKDTSDFVKNAAKNVNEPTVTINNTNNGNLKVRFDFVNKNLYSYRYDWWWHHQWHMQMWQHMNMINQQQIRNSIPKFGPAEPSDFFFTKNEKSYFEITLKNTGELSEDVLSESKYRELDKKSYITPLDNDKKLKHTSTVFTDNSFRYIAYDKRDKSIKIENKPL